VSSEATKVRLVRVEETTDDAERIAYETAERVKAQKPQWLLPGRIIANGLAILEGDQGAGKSTLLSGLVAAITSGRKWWSRPRQKPQNVLWLAGEEDPGSAIKPRLAAAKADLSRVFFPQSIDPTRSVRFSLPGSVPALRDAIKRLELALIVIDPLVCYADGHCDLNSELGARAVVDPLNQLALATGCCPLMTRHLRKDRTGPRHLHGLGSMGIGAAARSIIVLDYPDLRTERRVCRVVKCSFSPNTLATEFTLAYEAGVPTMTGIREIPRDDDQETGDLADPGERDVRADARLLLRRLLSDGPVMTVAIYDEAEKAGIGQRTLRTAKAELGITSRRVGASTPAHWEWVLPKEGK